VIQRQCAQARKDVEWMIHRSGVMGMLSRPTVAGLDSFFGPHEPTETPVGEIPVEMKTLNPADLAEIGADAVASVVPDSGVQEQDFLEVDGVRYRVTDVKSHIFFGQITHLELHLEREKRDG